MVSEIQPHLKAWLSTAINESAKQPVTLATAFAGLTVAASLVFMTLLISRYLSVFCEPALVSFGDVTRLLPTYAGLLAICTMGLVGLLALYGGAPILVRYLYKGSPQLPLARAYDWPNDKGSSRAPAAIAYVAAYLPLHFVSSYLALAYFAPDVFPTSVHLMLWAFVAGLSAPLLCLAFRWIAPAKGFWRDLGETLTFSILLSVFGAVWMGMVVALIGIPPVDAEGTALWSRLAQAGLVVLNLVGAHLLMTVASNHRGAKLMAFALFALVALIWAPGDQVITFNALRFTGAGGGVVTFYRDPKAAAPEESKPACLILTTGEYRIVWLVDDADRCARKKMLADFQALKAASPSDRQARLGIQRVLKSGFFVDQLPATHAPQRYQGIEKAFGGARRV